jgi:hypothetical protein
MSDAISGQGTIITLNASTISEITGWSGLGVSADTIEVTNIDSPDEFEEFIKVLLRGDEISIDMNYTASTYVEINALVVAFEEHTFTLQTTDNKLFTVPVLVTSNKMSGAAADKISATVTLKVTGIIVITDVT